MNPEVKARWVAALRSGEYKQGKKALRHAGKHCCLGVLCDLFAQERGKSWRTKELSERGPYQSYDNFNFPDLNLPGAVVCVWAQVDPYEELSVAGGVDTLFNHNDNGRTFAEIADAIEAQL